MLRASPISPQTWVRMHVCVLPKPGKRTNPACARSRFLNLNRVHYGLFRSPAKTIVNAPSPETHPMPGTRVPLPRK